MSNAIKMCYNDVMRTLTVKLYNSDDFGYLSDMINIAGIIYNMALMTHEKCILPGFPAVCKGSKAVL